MDKIWNLVLDQFVLFEAVHLDDVMEYLEKNKKKKKKKLKNILDNSQ